MEDGSWSLKEKIVFGIIGGVTFVVAIIIGINNGVRSRYVLYTLVGIELALYYGFKWLIEKIKSK